MTPIALNIVLFVSVTGIFALIGFIAARREQSVGTYFHHESLHKNVVSLIATNITLGTGLVYLVTGAQQNGLLMLIVPIMVWVGYRLQAHVLEKMTAVRVRSGRNILAALNEQIARDTGAPTPFAKAISISLVSVFILVLAFEIFASSKVIAPFLFASPTISAEVSLSMIIFAITIAYAILGGVRAIFGVDVIQVPLVLIFLPTLFITSISNWDGPSAVVQQLVGTWKFNAGVVTAMSVACFSALATQFYSILNWGAVSNVDVANQESLLHRVGLGTAIILSVFVLVGLLHPAPPGSQVWQHIASSYQLFTTGSSLVAYCVSAILMLGMAAILLTTTDAVVVNAILFWYDNVAGGNSRASHADSVELKRIRRIGFFAFVCCFTVLAALNYWQPDPFYFLLSMAGGVSVFAPMIAVALFLSSRGSLAVLRPGVIYLYVGVFLVSGVIDVILLYHKSSLVSYVGISSLALSAIISLWLVAASRHLEGNRRSENAG